MIQRPFDKKLLDIKTIRIITRFLGKLGIQECVRAWPQPPVGWAMPDTQIGLNLAEAKDYVESKYEYYMTASRAEYLRATNVVHKIKRVRQFMGLLKKLGIKSADSGLLVCRAFVLRQGN